MAKVKLCIICRKQPALVPDRERMGRPIKRICRECHAARLAGDVRKILAEHEKKQIDKMSVVCKDTQESIDRKETN